MKKGWVVCWTPPSEVRRDAMCNAYAAISGALERAGGVVFDVQERTPAERALSRAALDLAAKCEGVAAMVRARRWQVSARRKVGDEVVFDAVAFGEIDATGNAFFSGDQDWGDEFRTAYLHAERTAVAADVSSVVQQIFKRSQHWQELIPLRDRGAVYFVPDRCDAMVNLASQFVEECGGKFYAYSVTWESGDVTERSVAQAVADHMQSLVEEFRASVLATADMKNPEAGLARRAKRAADLRGQIEAYSALLGSLSATLKASVESAMAEAAEASARSLSLFGAA